MAYTITVGAAAAVAPLSLAQVVGASRHFAGFIFYILFFFCLQSIIKSFPFAPF
ncbi:hypothetical protein HDV64DRAFT_253023 [Trichoderma sp. TUCIM 5745]